MQNYYRFIMPRLNGDDIGKDFSKHLSLVRKGIAGFIIFGGRLETVRRHIIKLQGASELPLIMASDLERGLGQQLKGGTLFPPAMALAKASVRKGPDGIFRYRMKPLRDSLTALAEEARYAGINTILAPVLDINTNPDNPIIGVRSFGEDVNTVSTLGCEMIKTLQKNGITACGKHFPGHGDTETDSHISLPAINRSLHSIRKRELVPFQKAADEGVGMLMLGHLSVPALDPSGTPVSLSKKAVSFIREKMDYDGILITDAMNMGGLGGYSEEEASYIALKAGVDIVLHPLNPDRVVRYLKKTDVYFYSDRLDNLRRRLLRFPDSIRPSFGTNMALSEKLTAASIKLNAKFRPFKGVDLLVVHDEDKNNGRLFASVIKKNVPSLKTYIINAWQEIPDGLTESPETYRCRITAIFSETRAWKGNTADRLREVILTLKDRTDLFISFGNPYLLREISEDKKVLVYWDSVQAEKKAAELIAKRLKIIPA